MSRLRKIKILRERENKQITYSPDLKVELSSIKQQHSNTLGNKNDSKIFNPLDYLQKQKTPKKKNKIAIISAIFNNVDDFKLIAKQTIPFDLFYFNDTSAFPLKEFSPRLKAKFFKLQSHRIREIEKYETIIWIDGSFKIKKYNFISWIMSHMKEASIAVLKHQERICIYDEYKFIEDEINKGNNYLKSRYSLGSIRAQVEEYAKDGYPINNGLYSCGMFIRRQDDKTNKIFDDWWAENCKWSIQDQLSFPYVLWKNKMKVNEIGINIFDNEYFNLKSHLK